MYRSACGRRERGIEATVPSNGRGKRKEREVLGHRYNRYICFIEVECECVTQIAFSCNFPLKNYCAAKVPPYAHHRSLFSFVVLCDLQPRRQDQNKELGVGVLLHHSFCKPFVCDLIHAAVVLNPKLTRSWHSFFPSVAVDRGLWRNIVH